MEKRTEVSTNWGSTNDSREVHPADFDPHALCLADSNRGAPPADAEEVFQPSDLGTSFPGDQPTEPFDNNP